MQMMIVSNQQPAEVAEPGESPLYFPALAIASEFPAIVEAGFFASFAMRYNQQNASFGQTPAQWIAVA
jgi:hypothetical protein